MCGSHYLRIMYDPVSYIHKQRFSLNERITLTRENRCVLNRLIIENFGLSCEDSPQWVRRRFWLENWFVIPEIIMLLGCLALREHLIWKGQLNKFPEWCQEGVRRLPFRDNLNVRSAEPRLVTEEDVICEGYSRIREHINNFPLSLWQRVNLLFPADINHSETNHSETKKISADLLIMVSMHVKNYKLDKRNMRY